MASLALGATGLHAQNLLSNGDFGTGDLSGWSFASAGSDQTAITFSGSNGNPAGSALLDRVDSTLDDNKDIIYQIIPVTPGMQYQFDAQWEGDLYFGGDGRNWAEAMVTFIPTNDPITDGTLFPDTWIQYKIASQGGPNDPSTDGWAWESVLLSPNSIDSPVDGIFTATDNYMLVGFNLGGRDALDSRSTLVAPGFYSIDNVEVMAVPEPATIVMLFGGLALAIVCLRRFGSRG